MKSYNRNIRNGIHTIRITLQAWEYKGHIIEKVFGNAAGRNVIGYDFFEMGFEMETLENDCDLKYNEELDFYTAFLKDENGNELEINEDAEGMNNMIVAIEIIDYQEEAGNEQGN